MAKLRFIQYLCVFVTLAAFGLGFGSKPIFASEKTPPFPEEDVQVLSSGPIHEAFAEAVTLDTGQGIVSPKAPPELIEEIPPEQKPEGNVQWIPGYWAWDDERNEYIWVSGIWRVPPPGRQWVPGYWTSVEQGYQWISGYWASIQAVETEYLPEPPETVEVGPNSNAPSPDYTWMPGCWVWYYGRYAWRPGYWAVMHTDWVWVPNHYIWTPRGYIFVGGYWDYIIINRGVLFAPVFFPRLHLGLNFFFSPGFMINLNVFNDALFLRPRYSHYYFGNYYAPRYYRIGIYPWFSLHARRVAYDPIFSHQRWRHRNDQGWENNLHTTFRKRRNQKGLQPSRPFDLHNRPDHAGGSSGQQPLAFVMPLKRAEKTKPSTFRFKPLRNKERKEFSQLSKEVRTYQIERKGRETPRRKMLEEKASKKPAPNKEIFYRSPIIDRFYETSMRKKALPPGYKAPKPNFDVEPLQKKHNFSLRWNKSNKLGSRGQKPVIWNLGVGQR